MAVMYSNQEAHIGYGTKDKSLHPSESLAALQGSKSQGLMLTHTGRRTICGGPCMGPDPKHLLVKLWIKVHLPDTNWITLGKSQTLWTSVSLVAK